MKSSVDFANKVKEYTAAGKSIAPVENGETAVGSYAIGDQFMREGVLYKAKTAIEAGDSLVLDTNYELDDDVTTQLSSVKQALTDLEENLTEKVASGDAYTFRQGKGTLVDMSLVGGTVAWNQIIQNGNFASSSNWVTQDGSFTVSNNVASFTASAASGRLLQTISIEANHKYLSFLDIKTTTPTTSITLAGIGDGKACLSTTNWQTLTNIVNSSTSGTAYFILLDSRTSGWDVIQAKNAMCIDLTKMFGSTIADYIYSLEQATAGAGVAWFRQYFSKAYYAYNAGELLSVKPSGRKVVGKNLLNPSTFKLVDVTGAGVMRYGFEPIRLLAGTYTFSRKAGSPSTSWYVTNVTNGYSVIDASTNPFTFTLNADAEIMIRTGTSSGTAVNDTDIQLELGSTVTEYSPHDSTEYPFPSIDLRGVPKLVDNKLAYDGDSYKADGSVTRKYGIVDLGTLTWTRHTSGIFYSISLTTKKAGLTNIICSKYVVSSQGDWADITNNEILGNSNNVNVYINDTSYSDAATFKTAMSGVYLVYELATPTSETASPFINPERSYLDGTEEWIEDGTRDVVVPVGNNSEYYQNETYSPVAESSDSVYKVLENKKLSTADLKTVVAASSDFSDFKTRIAAL